MGKIKILPLHEAQKIAAGEIVERPANVVKELVENALDAGATHISVLIEEGGKKNITVIDNGCGMEEEDARLSIHNHATSKLSTVDDLNSIATFGFRGEALASIASVSQMTLSTKTMDAHEGLQLTIEAGSINDETKIACNTGTSLIIRNLFFNLPARKKFLKKDETEWNAIQNMMQALALTHCHCSFTVQHNNHLALHTPYASNLNERIAQVFDATLSAQIIPCSYYKDEHNSSSRINFNLSMTGAISHPSYHRYDRNHLFFFVNNRWIKNQKLSQALIKAYSGILPDRRYPAAVIFITIDPEYVDINIHPRKEEVQFLHPRIVEEALEKMVHEALQNKTSSDLGKSAHKNTIFSHGSSHKNPFDRSENSIKEKLVWNFGRKTDIPEPHIIQTRPELNMPEQNEISFNYTPLNNVPKNNIAKPFEKQASYEPISPFLDMPEMVYEQPEYRYIGTIHNTYIILETDEGMVMIDQHAAHERVLYEQFASRFEEMATVQLMFPTLITLSHEDHSIIQPWIPLFTEQGIVLETLSSTQYIVKSVPVAYKNSSVEELIKTALTCLHENSTLTYDEVRTLLYHAVRAMMACKAAVKAGDVLDEQQIHELIKKFHMTENRMTCPHGRPTTWKFSRFDIEKKFKRIE